MLSFHKFHWAVSKGLMPPLTSNPLSHQPQVRTGSAKRANTKCEEVQAGPSEFTEGYGKLKSLWDPKPRLKSSKGAFSTQCLFPDDGAEVKSDKSGHNYL